MCTPRQVCIGTDIPPPDGPCSGRYASYWNAFLYFNIKEGAKKIDNISTICVNFEWINGLQCEIVIEVTKFHVNNDGILLNVCSIPFWLSTYGHCWMVRGGGG